MKRLIVVVTVLLGIISFAIPAISGILNDGIDRAKEIASTEKLTSNDVKNIIMLINGEIMNSPTAKNYFRVAKVYIIINRWNDAYNYFFKANEKDRSYGKEIGEIYGEMAFVMLDKNGSERALYYFNKGLEFDPNKRRAWTNECFDYGLDYITKGKAGLAEEYFTTSARIDRSMAAKIADVFQRAADGAVEPYTKMRLYKNAFAFNDLPDRRQSIYESLIKLGNEMSNEKCYDFYALAHEQVRNKNPLSQAAGERLAKIARELDDQNIRKALTLDSQEERRKLFNDKRVDRYFELAMFMADGIEPNVKVYGKNDKSYMEILKIGNMTNHWLLLKTAYTAGFTGNGYNIICRDGRIFNIEKLGRFPNGLHCDMRFIATRDTRVRIQP